MKKEELLNYAFKIKPLVRVLTKTTTIEGDYGTKTETETKVISLEDNWENGKLSYISSYNDIAKENFMWDPDPILKVDKEKLQKIGQFVARFNDCRFFFKPSVKEVFEQMPERLLEKADCFEIVEPDLTPNNEGICTAKVIVYKSLLKNKHPEEILKQTIKYNGKKYEPKVKTVEMENEF